MDTSEVIIIAIIAFAINAAALYYIIKSATDSTNQIILLRKQMRLLKEIAKANGVSEQNINNAIDLNKKQN